VLWSCSGSREVVACEMMMMNGCPCGEHEVKWLCSVAIPPQASNPNIEITFTMRNSSLPFFLTMSKQATIRVSVRTIHQCLYRSTRPL